MKTNFIVGASSDAGKIKKINQDSIFVKIGESEESEFAVFVIADGMGGLSDGEVASRLCVHYFKQWWKSELKSIICGSSGNKLTDIEKTLGDIFAVINDNIMEYSRKVSKMVGSTLSVLFIFKEEFIIHHIGDSRIYRLKSNNLEQLTEDHSLVAQEIKAGRITKDQAKEHPKRNILTQCIGVHKQLHAFQARGGVSDEDIFLLCSDGFYNKLSDEELIESFDDNTVEEDLDATIRNMIHVILDRDEKDNISCIAVKVKQI